MIENTTIDGRKATVAYLDSELQPVEKDDAEFIKVFYDNGDVSWLRREHTVKNRIKRILAYDPDQDRDEDGKWTDEGGGGSGDEDNPDYGSGGTKSEYESDRHLTKSDRPLTKDERRQLSDYAEHGYMQINAYLNNREVGDADKVGLNFQIATIDRALETSKLTEDVTVYRGSRRFDEHDWPSKVGTEIEFKSYTSTSLDESIGREFANHYSDKPSYRGTLFEISASEGKNGININWATDLESSEREILFPRESRFKVTSVDVKNRRVKLRLL